MKILELKDFGNIANGVPPSLTLTTDSSAVRDNRPVFLPEMSQRWRCDFMPAYFISRLGKTISQRFAGRYFEKMTVAARFVPLDLLPASGDSTPRATAWVTAFDGAIAIGKAVEAADIINAEIKSPGNSITATAATEIDRAISLLSSIMTIKTGDIIIPPAILGSCSVGIGDHIEVTAGGEKVLCFNLK